MLIHSEGFIEHLLRARHSGFIDEQEEILILMKLDTGLCKSLLESKGRKWG